MKKILLNPGPVTVTEAVRNALLKGDNCHREKEIKDIIKAIRNDLVTLAKGDINYKSVLFVASGTGAIEAVINSVVKKGDFPLVISNGAYGERINEILLKSQIKTCVHDYPWGAEINLEEIDKILGTNQHQQVFVVNHETTTGILNPIREIGKLAKKHGVTYIVDAISSFGGIPLDIKECNIDYLVGVANKCIQGLPGLSFVIFDKRDLEKKGEISKSVYLDLFSEYKSQEQVGSFRFTAPIQILYSFQQAIEELKKETIQNRYQRYSKSYDLLLDKFKKLGFELFPTPESSKLLATFYCLNNKNFDFDVFHDKLYERDYVIYPGKLMSEKTFRIAVMGNIDYIDIDLFVEGVYAVLKDMKVL